MQVSVGLVAVIEQQDATLRCFAFDWKPVGQFVLKPVALFGKQDTEVLDKHGRHVSFHHWHVKFFGNLMHDGCLTTTGATLDTERTLNGEGGTDCVFK